MIKKLRTLLKQRLLAAKPNGQYRFLLQKINQTMDVDLASKVIQSDYYRGVLVPLPVEIEKLKKVAVFAPHQDDESIGCGGLLSALAARNCEIDLIFLTDGRPTGTAWEAVVAARKLEAEKVAQTLGAKMHEIGVNNVSMKVSASQFEHLKEICAKDYDAIFTAWPLDAPPKHRFCNALLAEALKHVANENLQVFTYPVHTALLPNVYFDYTEYFAQKQHLINLHQSQMETQNYAHISAGLDAWNSRFLKWSSKARYIEVFTQVPLKEWRKLIDFYKVNPEEAFRGNLFCLKSYERLNKL